MESLQDIVRRQQGIRPTYFDDPEKDRLIALLLELAEETCVLRDRVDTCRRLAAEGLAASDQAIEEFTVDEKLQDERLAAHTTFYEQLLQRILPPGSSN